jgi:hypothetical protein
MQLLFDFFNGFLLFAQNVWFGISRNVLAVCDGFVARISKPLGLQGYKTVAE